MAEGLHDDQKNIEDRLQSQVDTLLDKLVPSAPSTVRDKKIIHDSIWGTQMLFPQEVALLNTPLLQRLRSLHQTGFCHLTYPSALHTRFDHSLGVLYQASRLSHHLREKYQDGGSFSLSDSAVWKIRLAALLHDCSHGPFSHTSEEVYRLFDDMKVLTSAGAGYEGSSASEILAHFILRSGPFKTFFKQLQTSYSSLDFDLEALEKLILGQGRNSAFGFHTDIINGPFDADKLDYIFRDSHFSGLPMSVDIDRLWYSVEAQIDPKRKSKRLVINTRGVNSIEQIVFSRMVLTANVYHHHKVRACDCMFKAVIEYCKNAGLPLCGRKLDSAVDFLHITDNSFFTQAEDHSDPNVREMIGNLVNRYLFKRALVISMKSIEQDGSDRETEPTLIQNLIGSDLTELRNLAKTIWESAGKPCSPEEVWIDFPKEMKLVDMENTLVNTGTLAKPDLLTMLDFLPLGQWSTQYLLNKWRGHVFCPEQAVDKISKAAESVLQERYKIKFNKYATLLANIP
jgi:HD superfamily phosphohydrolase